MNWDNMRQNVHMQNICNLIGWDEYKFGCIILTFNIVLRLNEKTKAAFDFCGGNNRDVLM